MDAFYQSLGDGRFASTPAVVGPWGAGLAHGSPPAALLLHVIESANPRSDVRVAQLAYEFFGPVPATQIDVTAEMARPGARIDLSKARLAAGGRTAMDARAWRISAAPGRVPEVASTSAVPRLPPPQAQRFFADLPSFGYGEAIEWHFVEGGFHEMGPATVFARPRIPLVAGSELTPLERLLLMVDSANGIGGELPASSFTFVPVSLAITLWRHPRTEWTGMRARTTIDSGGHRRDVHRAVRRGGLPRHGAADAVRRGALTLTAFASLAAPPARASPPPPAGTRGDPRRGRPHPRAPCRAGAMVGSVSSSDTVVHRQAFP